jgi:hypothetical protein
MITFEHHGITVKCKPENAMQYRAAMDKPPKIKVKVDRQHDSMRRDFPAFHAGMETADYLSRYASLNNRLLLSAWKFDHEDQAAPMLDATTPEVLEELDPDWVPTAKARKITPKQAIIQALDALKLGDVDMAQCILEEALK